MRFCRQGPSLVVHTPAKLNLFLEVRGRRPDGYHELETIMVSIDLFDTIRVSPERTRALSLTVRDNTAVTSGEVPTDDRNLVLQAAQLLAAHCGIRTAANIELIKRIPVESGLGGGSSDAAATLVALNRLWRTELGPGELHQLAARLGSDVNFFLDSVAAAVCCGRGEQIQPISLPRRLHFVVVRPRSGLATRNVFGQSGLEPGENRQDCVDSAALLDALQQGRADRIGRELHNTLEGAARELTSDRGRGLEGTGRSVLGSAMTGSGSARFALCRSARHARMLGSRLRNDGQQHVWNVSSCL